MLQPTLSTSSDLTFVAAFLYPAIQSTEYLSSVHHDIIASYSYAIAVNYLWSIFYYWCVMGKWWWHCFWLHIMDL